MHLINALVAGIRGAESGTAQIYSRGTSSKATCYASFEGTVLAQPPGGFPLDASGAYEVYVNGLVDILCRNTSGTVVRSFTDGAASPNVEVRSQSFTGRDYTSGASAVSNPTTLQAALDLWQTSAGEPDFNVLFSGASSSIQNAIGSIAGIFTNVKSPQFGAVGDGVVDDTTALQNALNQSNIVFFPAGTYRTTSKLTVPVGTSLWGAGSAGSKIFLDHATADCLEYGAGTSVGYQEIRGMQIDTKIANNGILVSLTAAGTRWLSITQSTIGSSATLHTSFGIKAVTNAHRLLAVDSLVYGGTDAQISFTADTMRVTLRNVRVAVVGATYNATLVGVGGPVNISGCTFDLSAVSSGTSTCLGCGSNTGGVGASGCVYANDFVAATGGTTGGLVVTGINDASTRFFEIGNVFRSGFTTNVAGIGNVTASASVTATYRDSRVQTLSSDTTPQALSTIENGHVLLTRGTNTSQTLTAGVGPPGSYFTLVILNSTGGNLSIGNQVFGTGFVAGTPATPSVAVLANGKLMTQTFRVIATGGGAAWVPVSAQVQGLG